MDSGSSDCFVPIGRFKVFLFIHLFWFLCLLACLLVIRFVSWTNCCNKLHTGDGVGKRRWWFGECVCVCGWGWGYGGRWGVWSGTRSGTKQTNKQPVNKYGTLWALRCHSLKIKRREDMSIPSDCKGTLSHHRPSGRADNFNVAVFLHIVNTTVKPSTRIIQ